MRYHINTKLVIELSIILAYVIVVLLVASVKKSITSYDRRWYVKFRGFRNFADIFQERISYSQQACKTVPRNKNRGFYISAGELGSISSLFSTLYELRKSCVTDVITVGHCDEIKPNAVQFLKRFKGVVVRDLCARFSNARLERFRSYFCRHLLLVNSQHKHMAMVDIDLIWFGSPAKLTDDLISRNASAFVFNSVLYKHHPWKVPQALQTEGNLNPPFLRRDRLVEYLSEYLTDNQMNSDRFLQRSRIMNNISMVEVDSSYVYYQAVYAKPALKLLSSWSNQFHFGYGDQEAYWLSCVIAQVPLVIDKWGTAAYGAEYFKCDISTPDCECNSYQLHYHPLETANPALMSLNFGPLIEIQTRNLTKTKFWHFKCALTPRKYSVPESFSYTLRNFIPSCPDTNACVRHTGYVPVSGSHKRIIRERRVLQMQAYQVEMALNDVV